MTATQNLTIVPVQWDIACAFVNSEHRHHKAPAGMKFAIGVQVGGGILCGVAIIGRPVSRMLARNRYTLEVTRIATDGTPNACSALYGAAWRAVKAMGYRRLITYILANEPGTSLRAAGWSRMAEVKGGTWSRASRARIDKHPTGPKVRYEKNA